MTKTQSTTDISQLRKNRGLRIDYQHRYTPGAVKKQLTAEDVILGRYKYIPPIKLAEREKTRTFTVPKTRRHGVVSSGHRISTVSLPSIKLNQFVQRRDSVSNNYSQHPNSFNVPSRLTSTPSTSQKHPVIVIGMHNNCLKCDSPLSIDNNCDNFNNNENDDDKIKLSGVDYCSDESKHIEDNDNNDGEDDNNDDVGDVVDDDDDDDGGDGGVVSDEDCEYRKYREKLTKERKLTSPDFDTDLEVSDTGDGYDYTDFQPARRKKKLPKNVRTYYRSCSKYQLTPNKSFVRQCGKGTVDLRHRLITHIEVRPIAIALVDEQRTSFLDISMNPLGPIGTGCLSQVFLQNTHIVELNLSSTYPERAGLESLARCLRHNLTLRRLYLNNNELQPSDGDVIAKLIEDAKSLLELHLGNNNLGFGATSQIAKALVLADGKLKVLNLRYNNIRTDSASHLVNALKKNKTLQSLDVSWNGFGEAGCKALAASLEQNTGLKQLDLKCNRIGLKSLPSLIRVLTKNKGLNSVSISSNPLTTEGAKALLSAILANNTPTQLTQIDLRGIPVDQEFLIIKERLEAAHPIRVINEATVSLGTSDMSKAATGTFLDNYDPVMTMFEFMKKDNLRVIDMFQFFDIQKRDKLSKSDLAAGFKTLSIPFTKYQIDVIVSTLDKDKDGFISLDEMVKGYNKNDKTVKSRRIKASLNKTTDRGLENLWAYLKTLISKRKENNAKKNAITSQQRRNNFLAESNRGDNSVSPVAGDAASRKTSVSQRPSRKHSSVVSVIPT